MEPLSPLEDSSEQRRILEAQLRELFGRTTYSHKTQEKCADILMADLSRIKFWQIILSAISTTGFLTVFIGTGVIGSVVASAVAAILLALNLYAKNRDLAELALKHKQAATDIWLAREKFLSLITDLNIGGKPLGTIQVERDLLIEQLHSTYRGAPNTTSRAYEKAQKALKRDEEMTFSDDEIDAFLPNELRRS